MQMSQRVVLHIGAMKTGTTFLQELLVTNREMLAEHGFRVPRRPEKGLRGILMGEYRSGPRVKDVQHLLDVIGEPTPHTIPLSWEFLSFLDQAAIRRLLDALGTDADVVLTVRDTARTLPAQWQTRCRNGGTASWPRFADSVGAWLADGHMSAAARIFQRTQGIPRMLDTWLDVVDPDRLHVVTAPAATDDPLLLWRRFAEAVGIDPALPVRTSVRSNPSLDYPSAELLRRINVALGSNPPAASQRLIRAVIAPDLEVGSTSEKKVRLDQQRQPIATEWNARTADAIRSSGVRVIGDLERDLPTQMCAVETVPTPTPAELLAAADVVRASLAGLGLIGADARPETPERPRDVVRWLASVISERASDVDIMGARLARARGPRW